MNPVIRLARQADHAAMLDLWERAVRATHAFLTEEDIAALRPQVWQGFTAEGLQWWVICGDDGRPAGFLAYTPGCIEGLFIDPYCHRRGLGTLLVGHARHLADGPLRLDVNEGNPGAIAFYQAQGFTVTGRSPTDAEGRPFPVLHMRRG